MVAHCFPPNDWLSSPHCINHCQNMGGRSGMCQLRAEKILYAHRQMDTQYIEGQPKPAIVSITSYQIALQLLSYWLELLFLKLHLSINQYSFQHVVLNSVVIYCIVLHERNENVPVFSWDSGSTRPGTRGRAWPRKPQECTGSHHHKGLGDVSLWWGMSRNSRPPSSPLDKGSQECFYFCRAYYY